MRSHALCLPLGICVVALAVCAQAPSDTAEYLEALSHTAAIFASTAPRLMAEETLHQRGRRGIGAVLYGKKQGDIKNLDIELPDDFTTHDVVSRWGFAPFGQAQVLHEVRKIVSMDGHIVTDAGEARHAMTAGIQSSDDRLKRRLLEDFENSRLEGAVTDYGQVILLFEQRRQEDYEFSYAGERRLRDQPATVLHYRQISGRDGVTVFKERTAEREPTEGDIWFRAADLLPLRITIDTVETISKKYKIRTEATVDYGSSPLGLVPLSVTHRQLLNGDLLVENDLRYSGFERAESIVP